MELKFVRTKCQARARAMLRRAIESILEDKTFHIPVEPAVTALRTEKTANQWAHEHKDRCRYLEQICSALRPCLTGGGATKSKKKLMWGTYHKVRTSEEFRLLWVNVLAEMEVQSVVPAFYEKAADGVRKQASGKRSPALHRRPRTRSKGMGKRKKSRAKVTGSLWPTRALFVCVFLRVVAVMGSSEGWHVLSVASCDDGLRLLAGNSLCIALPRVGVCSNWNYRRVSWITAAFLLCCGDVEPNPGPNYKYPCTVCSYPVKCNQRGIQCSWCDKWTHAKCCGVTKTVYDHLSTMDGDWLCPRCPLSELPFFYEDSIHHNFSNNESLETSESLTTFHDILDFEPTDSNNLLNIPSSNSSITIAHLNIRSLIPKIDILRDSLLSLLLLSNPLLSSP